MPKVLIKVNKLAKYYPVPKGKVFEKQKYVKAVDHISFDIYEKETFGLVGESGCGKSTTGQLLIQLVKNTSGEVLFEDQQITNVSSRRMKELRKDIQIVFQDPYSSLNPKKKISWILEEPLIIHHIGDKESRRKKVLEVLGHVGLDESYLNRYPHELSGGQRQRIGIATALILNPKFIVIDEAVSALDVSVQSQILNLMKSLQEKFGLTFLFISHDLNVVQYMSHRIGVMYLGKLVEVADVDTLFENPIHPYTKALLSAIPSVNQKSMDRIILQGDVPNAINPPSGCSFHTRCPVAQDICKTIEPTLQKTKSEHFVSCHLYEEG